MKKYVSNNFKYFKNSKVNAALGHVLRKFKENKNCFPEFTKDNFGTGDLFNKYKNIYDEVNNRKAELKLKRINEKSNCLIEGAFSFSLDQWEKLEKENTKEELEQKITDRMNKYMQLCKDNFGFEPIGFEMHLDEGYEKQIEARKKNPDHPLTRNIHAHVDFFNYDFKKDCAPLRGMKKKDWAKCQDLAAECFKDLGFERGISKELTNSNHLEKDAFIAEKQKKLEEELEQKNKKIEKLENDIDKLNKKGLSKINQVKDINLKIDNAESNVIEVKKKGKKAVNQVREIRDIIEIEESKLLDLERDNQLLILENKKQEKNLNKYKQAQKILLDNMGRVVDYLGNLSKGFLELIHYKKEQKIGSYFNKIEELNNDFEAIKEIGFEAKNKEHTPFDLIVSNAIDELPEENINQQEIKTDLQKNIKTKRKPKPPGM